MRRKAIVLLVMMTMMVSIFAGCSEDKASSGTEVVFCGYGFKAAEIN